MDTSLERHFAAQEMAADRTLVKLFLEAVKVLKKGHVLCFGSEGSLAGIDELASRDFWGISNC